MPLVAAITPPEFGSPPDRVRFTHTVYNAIRANGLSGPAAELLTAHMALSTGWGKGVHNYMFAGVKAPGDLGLCATGSPDPGVPYVCLCTSERSSSTGTWVPTSSCPASTRCSDKNGIPRCKRPFRAYSSIQDGIAGVLKTLNASRYNTSRAYLLAGNPAYFRQLGVDGWYNADQDKMDKGMRAHWAEVQRYLGEEAPGGGTLVSAVIWLGGGYLLMRYARSKGWI